MGGKNKGAQRTKNNARPSSSGRSAELLSTTIPHFSGLKHIGFVSNTEEIDSSMNSDFQIVFKRMNKKDSTTKLKALQEFSDLVRNSEPEAVKLILSIWCRVYNSLATDSDNRIREAVQNAHYEVILRDKKMIAPYLKQIIGAWFTSQFDPYPPASSAGHKSFTATFSPEKIPNCLVFCQQEILSYIKDNILNNESNCSDQSEDVEIRLERLIIASLQGYSMFLEMLNTEQIQNCLELNITITKNPAFLRYSKHKLGIVRASWYQVISVILQNAPFLIENKNVIPIVFDNIVDSDPTVIPALWETLILIVSSVEDWQSYVNLKKQFVSKLWQVLQKGGNGCASAIYSNLLTLLAKMELLKDVSFYDKFFEKLRQGLDQRSVKISKSESTAVITTIFECLQYIILKNQTNISTCEKLINRHLSDLILIVFNDGRIYNKTIIQQTAILVNSWCKKQDQTEYKTYLECLNQVILNAFDKSFDYLENEELWKNVIESQKLFLFTFKNSKTASKKSSRVKFTSDADISENNLENLTISSDIDELYESSLIFLAHKVLKQYIFRIDNDYKSTDILNELVELIKEFKSREFLESFNKLLQEQYNTTIHNLILKWLNKETLRTSKLVDLIFLQYEYSSNAEKEEILNAICEHCVDESLGWCLIKIFESNFRQDKVVKDWLLKPKVEEYLIKVVVDSLENEWHSQFKILYTFIFAEDLIIRERVLSEITFRIEAYLEQPNLPSSMNSATQLTSFILNLMLENRLLHKYSDQIMLKLFSFICNCSVNELITNESFDIINSSIKNSLKRIYQIRGEKDLIEILTKLRQVLQLKFHKNLEHNHFVNIMVDLIEFITEFSEIDLIKIFFEFNSILEWRNQIWKICQSTEYILGNLLATEAFREDCDVFDGIETYFIWSAIKISVFSEIIKKDEEGDNEYMDRVDWQNVLLDLVMAKTLLKNYGSERIVIQLKNNYNIMKKKLNLIDLLPVHNHLQKILVDKLSSEAWLWSKVIFFLYTDIFPSNLVLIYKEYLEALEFCRPHKSSILHLTQSFGKDINYDCVPHDALSLIESTVMLNCLLHCDELEVQIAEVFGRIEKLRERDAAKFLLENKNLSWLEFQEIIEIVRFLSNFVKNKFKTFTRRHWDLIVISLTSWSNNCLKQRSNFRNIEMQCFMTSLVQLYIEINAQIKSIKCDNPKNDFVCEWEDLFLQNVHTDLLKVWFYLAEQFDENKELSPSLAPFLQQFGRIIENFDYKFIFAPDGNWTKVLKRCSTLLVHSSVILQLWSYQMMRVLLPGMVKIDATTIDAALYTPGFTIDHFKETLTKTNLIVNVLLIRFKIGEDSCQVEPFTDSFTFVFAYLLLWKIQLEFCEKSPADLRYQYADCLKADDLFKKLIDNLFKLMPMEVLRCSEGKSKFYSDLFFKEPTLTFNDFEICTSDKIEHLVCSVYASSLAHLPAFVRQWWSESDAKLSQVVDRITTFYVSPRLCNVELADVLSHETKFKNMVVKVLPQVREVVAIYTVDEAQMELVITLPINYPLRGPDVQCSRQIGGTFHKQWLMQLKKCLLHQNGRIWDGLSLWNCNLDKKFDGIEECYICFAVLHAGTYQLPKLSCQTCKKKFHSACLYKWFSTSNKSTCPICRNLF